MNPLTVRVTLSLGISLAALSGCATGDATPADPAVAPPASAALTASERVARDHRQQRTTRTRPMVIERERPAGWADLVPGGRLMDLFRPMPDLGGVTSDTWGGDNAVPRDTRNGIEDPAWSYWGGNTLKGPDGRYHLMVCRWPESAPKGHMAYHDSVVVHAVSDGPCGPFEFVEEIGPGHNPTWYRTASGRYVLYAVYRRYTADTIDGPWIEDTFDFDSRGRRTSKAKNYLHNNTFARREDGSFLMINRHGQAWFSRDGLATFGRVSPESVYPPVDGRFEDPVVWRDHVQYHLIVNDWQGRIAWYLRSKNGVDWKVDPGEAYTPGVSVHASGITEDWHKYERIRVLQDGHGRATAANFAVIDSQKFDDLPHDNHSSKLIVVPMTVGRLLEVENADAVSPETGAVRVRIRAEPGFDPLADVDVASLRFGASDEVSFGRGAAAAESRPEGGDLVVTFAGAHGLGPEHFAGKLLGRTAGGELLFGHCRLPGVAYVEPILSSKLPAFSPGVAGRPNARAEVEVQNFGQVASEGGRVAVDVAVGGEVVRLGSSAVPPLKPFETAAVQIPIAEGVVPSGKHDLTVTTSYPGRPDEVLTRPMRF